MKRIIYKVIASALILISLSPLPASATNANSFYFKDATFDYYLSKDDEGVSKMKVKETLTAVFPDTNQNHGITRVIPYTNQGGANLTMRSATSLNISVTRNGVPENIAKVENEDGAFIVYIGHSAEYVHGEQVYVLEYEFENVITEFDGYQELYWDTNGTGWTQTFDKLTANLHLFGLSAPSINETWCYVGRSGSSDQSRCKIDNIPDGLTFTTENLRAGENLTFATQFPAGTFVIKETKSYLLVFATSLLGIVAIAVIIYLICAYNKRARDSARYYKDLLTPAQYVPLKGLTAAELANIYIKGTGNAQVATLLELAVNHKVELREDGNKKWTIKVIDASNLTDIQTLVLRIFAGEKRSFTAGDEIPIKKHSSYSSERAGLISSFAPRIRDSLIKKGLIHEKSRATLPTVLAAIYIIALFAGAFIILNLYQNTVGVVVGINFLPGVLIITAVISGIIVGLLASKISTYARYTHAGLDASNYAEGLKEYISLAEKDRLKFLQSVEGAPKDTKGIVRLYEKLLPYAVLFGLEKSWLAQLQVYYNEDPDLIPLWYVGTHPFNTRDFNSALSSMQSSVASMASSSSSSGSGGGGFSGGGGGGGGGGGW